MEAWYLYDAEGNLVEQAAKLLGVTTSTYYLAGGAEEARSDGSLIKYYGDLGLNTGVTTSTISYPASDSLGSLQLTSTGPIVPLHNKLLMLTVSFRLQATLAS